MVFLHLQNTQKISLKRELYPNKSFEETPKIIAIFCFSPEFPLNCSEVEILFSSYVA